MITHVAGLYAGPVALLADDSRSSAIVKTAVDGARLAQAHGLDGDAQADRRVHGGVEKALHHFPAEHYAALAAAFPQARHLEPGGLGENISSLGLDEAAVCIGDIYRIGRAVVEVSQPRKPCWKIDHRAHAEGVAAFIAAHGLSGWYYRVLEAGEIARGDAIERLERPAGAPSLRAVWDIECAPRASPDALLRLADARGLNPDWARKYRERAAWLARNAAG